MLATAAALSFRKIHTRCARDSEIWTVAQPAGGECVVAALGGSSVGIKRISRPVRIASSVTVTVEWDSRSEAADVSDEAAAVHAVRAICAAERSVGGKQFNLRQSATGPHHRRSEVTQGQAASGIAADAGQRAAGTGRTGDVRSGHQRANEAGAGRVFEEPPASAGQFAKRFATASAAKRFTILSTADFATAVFGWI